MLATWIRDVARLTLCTALSLSIASVPVFANEVSTNCGVEAAAVIPTVEASASTTPVVSEKANALPALTAPAEATVAQSPADVPITAPAVSAPAIPGPPAQPLAGNAELVVLCPGASVDENGIIVVDNDEAREVSLLVEEYQWKEIPDEAGKTHISAGAQFPVRVLSALSSNKAKVGDAVEAVTKVDLKIGGRLIAPKGTRVVGHVSTCYPARRMIHAELSPKRWMRANGAIGVQFDEIITHSGEHLPLVAKPARQARVVDNRNEGRLLGVNHNGEVATPLSSQLKAQGLHLAIRAGCSAAGVFSFGAVPLAYGVVGAINPSFAFLHPVGKNVRHRRLKGFAMGVTQGLPGGFLIADYITKGAEAKILPGDEFLVEFKENFTGEAATEAQLMPNAKAKVHGEIIDVKENGKSKSKKKK